MSIDLANDFLSSSGGKSAFPKDSPIGTRIKGVITDATVKELTKTGNVEETYVAQFVTQQMESLIEQYQQLTSPPPSEPSPPTSTTT